MADTHNAQLFRPIVYSQPLPNATGRWTHKLDWAGFNLRTVSFRELNLRVKRVFCGKTESRFEETFVSVPIWGVAFGRG